MDNSKKSMYNYMVFVRCFTYNHEDFIKSALDGFVMQQTDFPYVCAIVDDASTDKTPIIVRNFVNDNFNFQAINAYARETSFAYIYYAPHVKNVNCYFAVLLLKENHWGKKPKMPYLTQWAETSKYHAICEGDDYWISSLKLQSQVDFLEKHPNYVLTCHRFKIYDFEEDLWSTDKHERVFDSNMNGLSFNYVQLYHIGWVTKTLTLLFRADALSEYYKFNGGLDYILVYFLMKNGLGYCFNEEWGVYRKSFKGICGKQSIKVNRLREYKYLKRLYEFDPNSTTKWLYYDKYASALLVTHGKLLLQERFCFKKLCWAIYYITKKIYKRFLFFCVHS